MTEESEIIKFINEIKFACGLMNDHLQLEYLNPQMVEFLKISISGTKPVALMSEFLSETEQTAFFDFYNRSQEIDRDNVWKVFNFIDDEGTLKQLLVRFLPHFDCLKNSPMTLLLGIPVDNIDDDMNRSLQIKENTGNQQKSDKYLKIFDNAIIGMILFDEHGRVEEINQTFVNQICIAKQEVLGKQIEEIFSGDLLEKVQKLFKMVQKSKHQLVKDVVTLEKKLNEHLILEISLSRFQNSNEIYDKTMMISEDITEQRDTHAALIQSEKLALTGRLAASLAHEINNPLQTSIGCLGLVEEMLNEKERKQDLGVYILMALDELKRSARIVKKLRDLNRKTDPSEKTKVNLQEVIESVLILTKNRLYDKNIIPVFPYNRTPPIVLAAKDQMQQVILNLVINAINAMPEGGNIYFEVNHTENPQGVTVKVRDTGHGMSKDLMAQLFDPFFTTKNDGLGLGLFICKEIIEDHNGTLEMDSQAGMGAEFTIWLPNGINPEN